MTEQTPPAATAPRQTWASPLVQDLPRLSELTLQTGSAIPGDCGTGGSGSTCF
jgi:hypothetical protein